MIEADDRYQRQALLPQFGAGGQRRLGEAGVLLVGCGALGCVIADQLARAGVGRLTLVDRDFVEKANLHRQPLFDEADAAEAAPKAIAAQRKLGQANSAVQIDARVADFNAGNARSLARGADVLVDGTDNFETRYLLNDLAVAEGLAYVYGGVVGTHGTQFTVLPRTASGDSAWEAAGVDGPCLACLWPQPPVPGTIATCDTAGVLGSAVAMVASMQAIEALKALLGRWDAFDGTLRDIEAWSGTVRRIDARPLRDAQCPCCGERRFDYLDGSAGSRTTSLCGRNAVQVMPSGSAGRIDLAPIAARLAPHGTVHHRNAYTLRCELEFAGTPHQITLFHDGRAIIQGTGEPTVARTIYSRYIGL